MDDKPGRRHLPGLRRFTDASFARRGRCRSRDRLESMYTLAQHLARTAFSECAQPSAASVRKPSIRRADGKYGILRGVMLIDATEAAENAGTSANARCVLIGTYKGNQLREWRGWYNYPVAGSDESVVKSAAEINELWLFNGTKNCRRFKTEFVGVKTLEALASDYGYPIKGKAHGERYLLFKTELISTHKGESLEDVSVFIRTSDFAKRSPRIAKQLKAYLESPNRSDPDLARRLPEIVTKLRLHQLHVCESAYQMTFCDVPGIVFPLPVEYGRVLRKSKGIPKPFVKWAGGKGQLLEQLDALLPRDFSSRPDLVYVEPFVGGGAMLFHVLGKYPNIQRAIINDLNPDLTTCYRVIKSKPEELISLLREMQSQYFKLGDEASRKTLFLAKRERYNSRLADEVETAALFIFLNRTCFNGLYRVNSKGLYNVPFGKAVQPMICDDDTIRADSELLQKVEILNGDFEDVIDVLSTAAFFYFDPPYRPLTKTAAFTAYSKDGFGDAQQKRLAQFARRLSAEGNLWLLSNSDPHNVDNTDNFFDDLFSGFNIIRVSASRMINSNAKRRGKIAEIAITNYKE